MKRQLLTTAAVFAATVASFATGLSLRAADAPVAKMTVVEGSVMLSRKAAAPVALKVGDAIQKNDEIAAADAARAEITLADQSVIRISSNSKIKLNDVYLTPQKEGDQKVGAKLYFGQMWAKVSKVFGEKEGEFKVETENAVAGVRGTTFRVNAATDNSVVVRVYAGAVAVGPSESLLVRKQHAKTGERQQVGKPGQITKKEWEAKVAKAMQEVKVSSLGDFSDAQAFAAEEPGEQDWVAWNEGRDDGSKFGAGHDHVKGEETPKGPDVAPPVPEKAPPAPTAPGKK